MASPAFGFLVGDFLAAVKLINTVRCTLKSTGGASRDFPDAIQRLDKIVCVFETLRELFEKQHQSLAAELYDRYRMCQSIAQLGETIYKGPDTYPIHH